MLLIRDGGIKEDIAHGLGHALDPVALLLRPAGHLDVGVKVQLAAQAAVLGEVGQDLSGVAHGCHPLADEHDKNASPSVTRMLSDMTIRRTQALRYRPYG